MLLDQLSLIALINNQSIKTETGEPLEFHTMRFLFDIYADRSPFICAIKAAQIGFTTFEILKTAHEAKNENLDIIYVLPTADDVKQFSGGKTNRIIDNNPVLQEWTADKDSIEQKRFGKATIYYRGSWTERTALMISARKLVVDEFDRCKQSIVEQYDSRLQAITNPRKAYFSNPSLPDFGIDKIYKLSDQKKWHINHSCGQTFVLDESCIDYTLELYICPKCGKEITDEERRMGEWIPTRVIPEGEVQWSGYWIPLWINPKFSAKKIAAYKQEKSAEYFANFVAGQAYINSTDQLSLPKLQKCLTSEVNERKLRTIIGLDTGHNLHYIMCNKQGVFFNGYVPSVAEMPVDKRVGYDPYDEIDRLLFEDKTAILVADQGGDLIGIRRLQAKYIGRVFLCWFTKETKTKELMRWGEKEEYGKVLADRNRVMQLAVDQINNVTVQLNGTEEDWTPFFEHSLNIYRVKEIIGEDNDPQYGWRWVWKRKGPDHFFLAFCYALIGLNKFGEELATFIKREDGMRFPTASTTANGIIPARRYGIRADFNQ